MEIHKTVYQKETMLKTFIPEPNRCKKNIQDTYLRNTSNSCAHC